MNICLIKHVVYVEVWLYFLLGSVTCIGILPPDKTYLRLFTVKGKLEI